MRSSPTWRSRDPARSAGVRLRRAAGRHRVVDLRDGGHRLRRVRRRARRGRLGRHRGARADDEAWWDDAIARHPSGWQVDCGTAVDGHLRRARPQPPRPPARAARCRRTARCLRRGGRRAHRHRLELRAALDRRSPHPARAARPVRHHRRLRPLRGGQARARLVPAGLCRPWRRPDAIGRPRGLGARPRGGPGRGDGRGGGAQPHHRPHRPVSRRPHRGLAGRRSTSAGSRRAPPRRPDRPDRSAHLPASRRQPTRAPQGWSASPRRASLLRLPG